MSQKIEETPNREERFVAKFRRRDSKASIRSMKRVRAFHAVQEAHSARGFWNRHSENHHEK